MMMAGRAVAGWWDNLWGGGPGGGLGGGLAAEVAGVVLLSLAVSGLAVAIAAVIGVPLGALLALRRFRGNRCVVRVSFTLMGLPPVLAGLVVFLILSRGGPLGGLGLLFTPTAMVIAQTLLVAPIITGLTLVAVRARDRAVRETALSLGATDAQATAVVVGEARDGIIAALAVGFGRAIAEVGAVMMVGGDIRGFTRVMTTAIVAETRKGNFTTGLWIGAVLLVISFTVNSVLLRFQGQDEEIGAHGAI